MSKTSSPTSKLATTAVAAPVPAIAGTKPSGFVSATASTSGGTPPTHSSSAPAIAGKVAVGSPAIADDSSDLYAALAAIERELSKLSNKKAKEALTMVCSVRNLRVVSMDKPIGMSTTSFPGAIALDEKKAKGPSKSAKASWKTAPKWIAAIAAHTRLVQEVKAARTDYDREAVLSTLHDHEGEMKALKRQLQGKDLNA